MFIIQADKSKLTLIESEMLVRNAIDVYRVRFNFSNDWNDFVKVAVFYNDFEDDPKRYSVLIDQSGMTSIPHEVLKDVNGRVYVGVCGESDVEQHLPTVIISLGMVQESICDEYTESEEPTPNIYQQILSELAKIRADIEAGMLVGPEGKRGPMGLRGPKGEQGIQGIQGLKGDPGKDATICGRNIINIFPGINIYFEETGEALIINAASDDGSRHYFVRYYDWDGKLLYQIIVPEGGNAINPVVDGLINTPEREPTPANIYTFIDFGDLPTDIHSNVNLTARYTETIRTYQVRFYNDTTLLETVETPYGTDAVYTGEPAKKDITHSELHIFTGWSPEPTNIQGDMDCYAQYEYIGPTETITDSWEEIIQACSDGSYKTKYKIKDTKLLDLGSEGLVAAEIVGMDVDSLPDDAGKAPITWITKQAVYDRYSFNESGSSNYFSNSAYSWSIGKRLEHYKDAYFPSELQNGIKGVVKLIRKTGFGTSDIDTPYTLYLWIPSAREINMRLNDDDSVIYNEAFSNAESRVKRGFQKETGKMEIVSWGTRTPASGNNFYEVTINGTSDSQYAKNKFGVVIGFCT